MKTLAVEIGAGTRQTRRYIAELERFRLIRRRDRFANRAQTSNAFEFLWHELFAMGVTDSTGEGLSDPSPGGCQMCPPKRVRLKRVILKREKQT